MRKQRVITDEALFLGFCIEIYKMEKKISGQNAFNYLYRTGATEYLLDGYDALHTTSPLYIIDSIDEYIKNSSHK